MDRLDIYLFRKYYPTGTNGRIVLGNAPICKSIELPWQDNKRKVSCIPEDTYPLSVYDSPKHGECLLLMNVPNRAMVEMHEANWALGKDGKHPQLEGCIAPVTTLDIDTPNGKPGVGWRSGDATNKLEGIVIPFIKAGGEAFITITKDS